MPTILFFIALLFPLGIWMLWSGWSEGVGMRIAIGATFLFVAIVVSGALAISARRSDRRHRRKVAKGLTTGDDGALPSGADAEPAGDDAPNLDVRGLD